MCRPLFRQAYFLRVPGFSLQLTLVTLLLVALILQKGVKESPCPCR